VHLFVLTLGFSRRMYSVATVDEKMPAFLQSHEEAFAFLGGVPHEIVYDNLRSVVLGRDVITCCARMRCASSTAAKTPFGGLRPK